MIKQLIHRVLGRSGRVIINTRRHYDSDGLFTVHSDHFRNDIEFTTAYARGLQANGGVDPHFEWRLHVALWAASNALSVPGDFVECGVNKGFMSSAIMRALNWKVVPKRFHLVDTFEGPVVSQFSAREIREGRRQAAEDQMAAGAYETNLASVRVNFAEWPNAVLVQGRVPDILSSVNCQHVAFLHVDMNCAYPERQAIAYFWSRLSPRSLVLLDDYAYFGYESQRDAIDELSRELGFQTLSLPTGQGLIMKR
jgi:hypothetical protein